MITGSSFYRRRSTLLAMALLAVVAATSIPIVLLDRRPLCWDPLSNLLPAVELRRAAEAGTDEAWRQWVRSTGFRPPLPAIAYLPALLLLSDQIAAVRLVDLAVFLFCLWLVYSLGTRLSSERAGLIAALLFATFPLAHGWARMGNADPFIWASLLLLLRVLLDLDLRSPWQATALGLSLGVCLATRLLCLSYLVGPAVWLAIYKIRSPRSALHAVVAAVWAVAFVGWWYVMQLARVVDNFGKSHTAITERGLVEYLSAGFGWVITGGIVGAAILLRARALPRAQLALLLLWIAAPLAQFATFWSVWDRYLVPLVPVCALLLAAALDQVTAAPGHRAARTVAWALVVLVALAPSLQYFSRTHDHGTRGLMWPDTRRHDGLERALALVPDGEAVLVINETTWEDYGKGILASHRRPRHVLVDPSEIVPEDLRYVVRIAPSCDAPRPPCEFYQPSVWWRAARERLQPRQLAKTQDPNEMGFELFAVSR